MAREQQHAETVGPAQLAAMNRNVLLARPRVAGDHQAGRDVGAAVVLVVGWQWKQLLEIDLTMDDFLRRPRFCLPPWDGIKCGVLKSRQHLFRFDTHRFRHPVAIGHEAGDNGNRMSARTREQRCTQPVQTLRDRRQLETKAGAGLDPPQPVARRKMIEPVTQRTDRLRRVVAVRSRGHMLSARLQRFAHGVNDLLVSTRLTLQNVYHRGQAGPTRLARSPASALKESRDMTAARVDRIWQWFERGPAPHA